MTSPDPGAGRVGVGMSEELANCLQSISLAYAGFVLQQTSAPLAPTLSLQEANVSPWDGLGEVAVLLGVAGLTDGVVDPGCEPVLPGFEPTPPDTGTAAILMQRLFSLDSSPILKLKVRLFTEVK